MNKESGVGTSGNRRVKRIIKNKREHHGALLIFAAVLAGLIFVVNLIMPDKDFSANENRALAGRPSLSVSALADGSFFSDYTNYYSDQFPLRDFFMSLKFRADYLMNQREFSGVYTGKGGTLLQKPVAPVSSAVAGTTDAINRFASKYSDKDITVLIAPDAAAIWKDKLPPNAAVRNQESDIYNFTASLDGSIRCIDAVSVLKEHASEEIYYKTDHHWTSLGAYNVFQSLTDPLKLASEGIVYTPHVVSESFQGTLSSKSGDHRSYDTITVYEPQGTDVIFEVNYPDLQKRSASLFVSEQLEEKDQYTVFFGGNHPLVEIRTTADNGRNLLIFKDSYANSFIQFLTPYYQTIVMVDPRYYYDDVSLAMNTYSITDVLFLYSADTLLADTALTDVLNAALGNESTGAASSPDASGDGNTAADGGISDESKSEEDKGETVNSEEGGGEAAYSEEGGEQAAYSEEGGEQAAYGEAVISEEGGEEAAYGEAVSGAGQNSGQDTRDENYLRFMRRQSSKAFYA